MADTQANAPQTGKDREEAVRRAQEKNAASVEGARSVGEAVKRFADAAVAEASKVRAEDQRELLATGTVGGRFRLTYLGNDKTGFGPSGTVLLNGAQVSTNGWSTTVIEGTLPADARSGEVVVWMGQDVQRRGYLTL